MLRGGEAKVREALRGRGLSATAQTAAQRQWQRRRSSRCLCSASPPLLLFCRCDPCHPALPRACTRMRGRTMRVAGDGDGSGAVADGQRTASRLHSAGSWLTAHRRTPRRSLCVHRRQSHSFPVPSSRVTRSSAAHRRQCLLRPFDPAATLGRRRARPAVRRLVARVHFLRSLFGASLLPLPHRRHAGRQSVRAVVGGAAQG